MELEGFDGTFDGSYTSLILKAWAGIISIVSIYGGGVASHSWSDIVSLPQTNIVWIVCVFWKELISLLNDLMTYRKHVLMYVFARNPMVSSIYFKNT